MKFYFANILINLFKVRKLESIDKSCPFGEPAKNQSGILQFILSFTPVNCFTWKIWNLVFKSPDYPVGGQ